MAKKKETERIKGAVVISLYGFDIKADTLYEVQEKYDASAPDGLQEARTSKLLTFDLIDGVPGAIWDDIKGNWDTGLYEGSRALREAFPGADLQPLVTKLKEYVVDPYEVEIGQGKISHVPSDEVNSYWDNFIVSIYRGRVFNTANPRDLLELYLAVLHRKLTPKEKESTPDFLGSYYLIVDQEGFISKKAENREEIMKAMATFYAMRNSDKETLIRLLGFLGLPVSEKTDNNTLTAMFDNWLNDKNDKYQNNRLFNETVEILTTEEGKDKLYIFSKLKDLKAKGKVAERRGEVTMDGTFVTTGGLKNATDRIYSDKELYELFTSLI